MLSERLSSRCGPLTEISFLSIRAKKIASYPLPMITFSTPQCWAVVNEMRFPCTSSGAWNPRYEVIHLLACRLRRVGDWVYRLVYATIREALKSLESTQTVSYVSITIPQLIELTLSREPTRTFGRIPINPSKHPLGPMLRALTK